MSLSFALQLDRTGQMAFDLIAEITWIIELIFNSYPGVRSAIEQDIESNFSRSIKYFP